MIAITFVIGLVCCVFLFVLFVLTAIETGWDSERARHIKMYVITYIPLAFTMIILDFLDFSKKHSSTVQIKDIISLIHKRKTVELCRVLMAVFMISALSIMGLAINRVLAFIGPILGGILLISSVLDHAITWYRMRCGLYGTCESEAREIISFMLEQKSKNGDGGGKMTLQFTPEELEKIVAPNESGGEAHA